MRKSLCRFSIISFIVLIVTAIVLSLSSCWWIEYPITVTNLTSMDLNVWFPYTGTTVYGHTDRVPAHGSMVIAEKPKGEYWIYGESVHGLFEEPEFSKDLRFPVYGPTTITFFVYLLYDERAGFMTTQGNIR